MDGVERPTHDPDSATCHRTSLSGPTGAGPRRTGPGRRIRRAPTRRTGARRTVATGSPVQPVAVRTAPLRWTVPAADRVGTALANGPGRIGYGLVPKPVSWLCHGAVSTRRRIDK